MELIQASHQWATRPQDERFVNLLDLRAKVAGERERSVAAVVPNRALSFEPAGDADHKGLAVHAGGALATTTNWAFGQLASLAKAPAGYLRGLPAPLAADCLNYGLRFARDVEEVGLLATQTDHGIDLRAATGPNYGRVWNAEVVDALVAKFGDGRTGDFRVPGEFGREVAITKANTTIYGSDRDIFVFLADETNRVEVKDRRDGKGGSLARGFFVWNSEVGSQSIGAAFFLFDYACSNRIVWGAQGFKEIRLRHTSGAPSRWLEQVEPVLLDYAHSAAGPIEAQIAAAQKAKIDRDLGDFLKGRFSASQVRDIEQAHIREEGRPIETIWDAVTGVTAFAKGITFQDERVGVERAAGKLLDLVTG